MTSAAQVSANRANAQQSTGPRTPEGKAAVAQNAVRHGLLAKEIVIKGEDPGEFEFYRDQMLAELAPVGQMELLLAERIVSLSWRLRRAERMQTAAFDRIAEPPPSQPEMPYEVYSKMLAVIAESNWHPPAPPEPTVPPGRRRAVQDFSQERLLDRLVVYERRIENSLYRTMAELRKLRKEGGITSSTGIPFAGLRAGLPVDPVQIHGRDAHATGGQDARATEPPEGLRRAQSSRGTPNEDGNGSCETKPIAEAVSSGKLEVASEPSPTAETSGLPTSNCQLPTGDASPCEVGANVSAAPAPACQTKPMDASGSTAGQPVSKRRKIPRMTNAAGKWAYSSYLGRWVPLCASLTEEDLQQAEARMNDCGGSW